MDLRQQIESWCEQHAPDESILLADGFEGAFIGLGYSAGDQVVACYDIEQCLKILMLEDNMSHEEAAEYFSFNVQSAYVGPQTPIFVHGFRLQSPRHSLN